MQEYAFWEVWFFSFNTEHSPLHHVGSGGFVMLHLSVDGYYIILYDNVLYFIQNLVKNVDYLLQDLWLTSIHFNITSYLELILKMFHQLLNDSET